MNVKYNQKRNQELEHRNNQLVLDVERQKNEKLEVISERNRLKSQLGILTTELELKKQRLNLSENIIFPNS